VRCSQDFESWMNRRALAFATLAGLTGCAATPDASSTVSVVGPAYDQFVGGGQNGSGVHVFLENQCGTLDCHGQVGRPFRLYSVNGLRDPNEPGLVSGVGEETPAELYSNYVSAVGLQPEEMIRVVAGTDPPTDLLLVQKPMGLVSHKGGIRILLGDSMYTCLTSWLSAPSGNAQFSAEACTQAAALP
jgi:hypothetical protein